MQKYACEVKKMAKFKISAVPYGDRTHFRRAGIEFPTHPAYLVMEESEIPQAVWEEPSLIKERLEEEPATNSHSESNKKGATNK